MLGIVAKKFASKLLIKKLPRPHVPKQHIFPIRQFIFRRMDGERRVLERSDVQVGYHDERKRVKYIRNKWGHLSKMLIRWYPIHQ